MSKSARLALAGLLAACQSGAARERRGDDAGAPAGPTARVIGTRDGAVLPAPAVPLPRETGFELLDPGAEPRARWRYQRAAAAERTVTAELAITSRTLRDGIWTERVALPPITQALAVQPGPGGLRLRPIPIAIAAGGGEIAQRLAVQQTARWTQQLERRRVDAVVDDRGRIAALAFADLPGEPGVPSATPSPARDELWQYLLGLAVPLPDPAIGVGARWRVTTGLRAGTASVTQRADYRLAAIDGDTWTVELTIRRIGERQHVEAGGLPPDTAVELIGLFREVTGEVTIAAADPLPRAGRLELEVRTHARFMIPGEPVVEVASEDVGTVTLK